MQRRNFLNILSSLFILPFIPLSLIKGLQIKAKHIRITAIAATLNKFYLNNKTFSFTEEQLQKLAATASNVPITTNFDYRKPPQGYVTGARVKNGQLLINAELFNKIPNKKLYLVPGYLHPEFKSVEYALTTQPADKSLPFIKL